MHSSRRFNGLRHQRALTLLEVLVALVVTSFVVTLLSQMLFQLGRIERRLEETGPKATQQAWRVALLAETVRGLQPFRPGQVQRFHGDAKLVEGFSLTAPFGQSASVQRFRLAFRTELDTTRLEMSQVSMEGQLIGRPVALLEWAGAVGSFAFFDQQGQLRDDWTDSSREDWPALPVALLIRTGLPGPSKNLLLRTGLTPSSAPLLRDMERL